MDLFRFEQFFSRLSSILSSPEYSENEIKRTETEIERDLRNISESLREIEEMLRGTE